MLHQNKKSGLGYRYITDHLATDTDSGTEGVNGVPDLDEREREKHYIMMMCYVGAFSICCVDGFIYRISRILVLIMKAEKLGDPVHRPLPLGPSPSTVETTNGSDAYYRGGEPDKVNFLCTLPLMSVAPSDLFWIRPRA